MNEQKRRSGERIQCGVTRRDTSRIESRESGLFANQGQSQHSPILPNYLKHWYHTVSQQFAHNKIKQAENPSAQKDKEITKLQSDFSQTLVKPVFFSNGDAAFHAEDNNSDELKYGGDGLLPVNNELMDLLLEGVGLMLAFGTENLTRTSNPGVGDRVSCFVYDVLVWVGVEENNLLGALDSDDEQMVQIQEMMSEMGVGEKTDEGVQDSIRGGEFAAKANGLEGVGQG
ncbi:hypothetical protein C8F04DRAFT_1187499 [Mycena alexandri]|uniref:Uncharacterized protein n=1 Tax=Mycena alexandri TaxID=1745969 RepID=A0AAD6WW68_9AGAR|nr:hypothetical protein C8F04DRAFT_1187499 [Mycena alexandri]